MDEVVKIVVTGLVGAVGGFGVGVSTEPIKLRFQNASKTRQMAIALYREMAFTYEALVARIPHQKLLPEGHHMYVHDISHGDSIFKQLKGDILYAQISGIRYIEGFYLHVGSFKGKSDRPEDWKHAANVLDILNTAIKKRELNRRLLMRFVSPGGVRDSV